MKKEEKKEKKEKKETKKNLKKRLMSLGLAASLATSGAAAVNTSKAEDTPDYNLPEYEASAEENTNDDYYTGHTHTFTWYTDPYGVQYGICNDCGGMVWSEHQHVPGDTIVIDQGTCWHPGEVMTACRSCNMVIDHHETGLNYNRHIAKGTYNTSSLSPEGWLKEPTCTEDGIYGQRCSSCNAEIIKYTSPAKGHTIIKENDVEATCEKDGYTGKEYCKDCGVVTKERNVIPSHGHISGVVRRETDPTCTTEGLDVAECKYCGLPMIRPVAPIGHAYDSWKTEIPASSTQEGLESRECVYCHDKETRKVPKKKHDCSIDGHVYRSEGKGDIPYDFTASLKEYVGPTACDDYWETLKDWCLECGCEKLVSRTFKKGMGHHFKWTVTKEATETEEGLKTGTCPSCGTVTTEIIPKIEHKHDCDIDGHISGVVRRETDPTCTTEGLDVAECQYCGLRMIRPVDALGHKYGDWKIISNETCETEGLKAVECERCGEIGYKKIPAKGHNYSDWNLTGRGTCLTGAEQERICESCGKKETRINEKLKENAHGLSLIEAIAPTFTEDGHTSGIECVYCKKHILEPQKIEKLNKKTYNLESRIYAIGSVIEYFEKYISGAEAGIQDCIEMIKEYLDMDLNDTKKVEELINKIELYIANTYYFMEQGNEDVKYNDVYENSINEYNNLIKNKENPRDILLELLEKYEKKQGHAR